ncbi:hypothetical protein GQ457_02G029430 [Hibiscus cannabinus]
MIATYAPCEFVLQQDLWRRLLSVIGDLTKPCCCGGDFNAVLSLDERRHCVGDLRNMASFRSFVEEAGLLDIPDAGKVFTCEQFILNRGVSDHAPVRLSSGECDWGPRPFRFLNYWLEKKGHVRLMESKWRRIGEAAGSPVNILEKLRRLKSFLKVWNRESFGSVDLQIEVTTDLLNDLDERIGGVEEVQWLREGDRNTKFFQQAAKIRGMRNYIRGLQINGRWVSSPKLLKSGGLWVVQQCCGRYGWLVMRVKADALDCFFDEAQWWCCPLDCSFPVAAGLAGCGGVLRDGDGHIIALFSGPLGILDSNVAEIWAIAAALDILVVGKWEGVSSFVIESDSAVALSWILHKERRPWRLDRWFRDIDGACLMLPCVCFNHVLREANALADVLAKGGVDRSDWLFLCA